MEEIYLGSVSSSSLFSEDLFINLLNLDTHGPEGRALILILLAYLHYLGTPVAEKSRMSLIGSVKLVGIWIITNQMVLSLELHQYSPGHPPIHFDCNVVNANECWKNHDTTIKDCQRRFRLQCPRSYRELRTVTLWYPLLDPNSESRREVTNRTLKGSRI